MDLTRVVSTANSNLFRHGVLNVHTTNTRDAKVLGEVGVGEMELSVLAVKATNRLAGGTLAAGPLGLLVASGAGVGAHGTVMAGLTTDRSHNAADQIVQEGDILDTRPATKAKVVKRHGAVFRREGIAVNLAVGEFRIHALAAAGRAAAATAGGRDGSGDRARGGSR